MFDFLKYKSLRAKQEAVPMQWSKDLPTKTGNYICAYQYKGEWNYIERKIFESNDKLFYISFNEILPVTELKDSYTHFMKIEEPE